MKKVFVFCVGGTGIRVMKSVTMLMASGMSTNGYTVIPVILVWRPNDLYLNFTPRLDTGTRVWFLHLRL